jgi:hypothetical protein
MITEQIYKQAQEIIKLYEQQMRKLAIIQLFPTLDEGMILEYKDLTGRWYEYTKDLQDNIHFEPPLGTRVRRVENTIKNDENAVPTFREQMKQDFIPRVWRMAEKEKEHLNWLIDNNAPKDMIKTSQKYLNHFRQRHKEYVEYAESPPNEIPEDEL